MAQLTEKQRAFIAEHPYVGTVTTIRPDGTPHSTVVWVDAEDGVVTFNTAVGRAKERYLRQNPHAAITVVDPENAYEWVSVSGPAEITTEGADEHIDSMAHKYSGEGWTARPGEQRLLVRVRVEHVSAYGF